MLFDLKCCGARIRTLRENMGMTQSDLAERLHITNIHLSRIEHGYAGASLDLLLEITEVFHTSLDYLVKGKNEIPDYKAIQAKIRCIIAALEDLEGSIGG